MILTFILNLFASLWAWAFQIIPVSHIPAGVSSAISTTISWVWIVNPFLDVPTLLYLFKLWLGIEIAVLGLKFVFWVYSKIPVVGRK